MKLQELVDCSAPLLAEDPDESAYPYWFGGTCFRVRHSDHLYVVTAEHCLKDKPKDQVRVQRHPDSRYFLTLRALFTQKSEARHEQDPDQDDWAVLRADEPPMDDPDPLGAVLDLAVIPQGDPHADGKLVVRGYPKALSKIDYDINAIRWRAFGATGAYVGKTQWSTFCHTMRLDDVSGIESVDGLSGSPIFCLIRQGTALSPLFVGMVLRGSKKSGLIHFLDARVVCTALAKAAAG